MTLSRFLRDYIYIPLGGNRLGKMRNYLNLFSVFLIGGLWHGASWMFVIWGALHGSAIVIHRIWKDFNLTMNKYLAWFITFNFVNIAWVFFRAKDFEAVKKVLGGMVGFGGVVLPDKLVGKLAFLEKYGVEFLSGFVSNVCQNGAKDLLLIAGMVVFTIAMKNSLEMSKMIGNSLGYALIVSAILYFSILHVNHVSEFIYFNF